MVGLILEVCLFQVMLIALSATISLEFIHSISRKVLIVLPRSVSNSWRLPLGGIP
ncbi:hypothetical protein CDL12_02578 [Handroanthus impetiginosus]|uniref:Uncharacterized protein n=1 Tax=Handroanthus impetiginosus TaxID=429701 RepID=A0A2G9I4L2_9LAMI|nr:hypothetical protein CDL12_02578 [Handroanthus impetiginosus]